MSFLLSFNAFFFYHPTVKSRSYIWYWLNLKFTTTQPNLKRQRQIRLSPRGSYTHWNRMANNSNYKYFTLKGTDTLTKIGSNNWLCRTRKDVSLNLLAACILWDLNSTSGYKVFSVLIHKLANWQKINHCLFNWYSPWFIYQAKLQIIASSSFIIIRLNSHFVLLHSFSLKLCSC